MKAKDAAGNESSGSSITVTIPIPTGYTGVRSCLEGKYCLDSNQIGYVNERVTVNGTPLNINGLIHGGDGRVYATQANIDAAYMVYLQLSNDYNITSEVYNSYVEKAQSYLKNLGYYLGSFGDNGDGIDGKWKAGGVTYTAIIQFQKSCKSRWTGIMASNPPQDVIQAVAYLNLNPTGMLDQETLNALSIESSNAVPTSINIDSWTNSDVLNAKTSLFLLGYKNITANESKEDNFKKDLVDFMKGYGKKDEFFSLNQDTVIISSIGLNAASTILSGIIGSIIASVIAPEAPVANVIIGGLIGCAFGYACTIFMNATDLQNKLEDQLVNIFDQLFPIT